MINGGAADSVADAINRGSRWVRNRTDAVANNPAYRRARDIAEQLGAQEDSSFWTGAAATLHSYLPMIGTFFGPVVAHAVESALHRTRQAGSVVRDAGVIAALGFAHRNAGDLVSFIANIPAFQQRVKAAYHEKVNSFFQPRNWGAGSGAGSGASGALSRSYPSSAGSS